MSALATCPASTGSARCATRSRPARISGGSRAMDELRRATNRNVKVDVFLGKRAHLVVEAERVLAGLLGRKDKVAAPLLFALENDLATRALDDVVDIKRTARL